MRLRDVQRSDVQRLIGTMLLRGYSVQAAKHVKTAVSAIYTHAEREGWFNGPNPAKFVALPEMVRASPHALSLEQFAALLRILPRLVRVMVFLAVMTSMNIAEICGLRWKRINLALEPVVMDAESLPPCHAGVPEQWYKGQWGSVKARARQRNVLLPRWVVSQLQEIRQQSKWNGPDDPVFAGKTGVPRCENAILKRHLKPAGEKLGVPWLSWHHLRHTFATLADQEKISIGERKARMGHANAEMTLHYTHTPTDQACGVLERLADKVVKAADLEVTGKKKVIRMKRAAGQ